MFVNQAALKLMSMFATTFVNQCSKHRSVLTDTHVKELLRVAAAEYKPDLKRLVDNKDCQVSQIISLGDLLLLVGGGRDGAVRIHYSLGTAHHRHQQEETKDEEEEESEAQVHVYLKLWRGVKSLVHVS